MLQSIINYLQANDHNSEWKEFYQEVINGDTSMEALVEALNRTFDEFEDLSEKELTYKNYVKSL